MSRKVEFSIGEYYHLYNRGTEKREIFLNNDDYERFIVLLYLCNSKESVHFDLLRGSTSQQIFGTPMQNSLIAIGAYCLMPNHFHLLVKEKVEGGISLFMQKLLTGYTMFFNKKRERTGALFGGRFKAIHVNDDIYLKYLFSYIHLNPVKIIDPAWKEKGITDEEKTLDFLKKYQFSSYPDYLLNDRERVYRKIIRQEEFPSYFSGVKDFSETIKDWLVFARLNLAELQRGSTSPTSRNIGQPL